MKKPEVYLKPIPKDIIELAKENAELKRGIGDLFLLIHEKQHDRGHNWLKNKNEFVNYISDAIHELYEENKEFKESLKAVKNP